MCQTVDVEYGRVRDQAFSGGGPVTGTWAYTRGWRVSWCAYGPNAADNLRAVRSALFMDYFTNALSLSNLFPLPDAAAPTYVPELINAQWYPRADFQVDLYEGVTETIQDAAVTSVEVKLYDGNDLGVVNPVADVDVLWAQVIQLQDGGSMTSGFSGNEIPSASGAQFVLAHSPNPPQGLQLFVESPGFGWVLLDQGPDYTLSGNSITIVNGNSYAAANTRAWYRY
jgi:hypothetical protein